jgi:hypothetical protein
MSQSLILIDAQSSASWEGEKKGSGYFPLGSGQWAFFPGPDMPFWLCSSRFSWLLGAITG